MNKRLLLPLSLLVFGVVIAAGAYAFHIKQLATAIPTLTSAQITIDSVTGDYEAELGVGEIHIAKQDATHIRITGKTILAGPDNSADSETIKSRTGDLQGEAVLEGNKAVYVDSLNPACKIDITFDQNTLTVSGGTDTCDATLANADGTYNKAK